VRRSLAAGALAGLIAACAPAAQPSPTPAPPTPTPTPQARTTLVADLRSTNEVPPASGAEAACSGRATVTIDTGASPTVSFEITVSGCSTTVTAGHIHEGAAGVNGSVRVNTGISAQQPEAVQTGGTMIRKPNVSVDAALAQQIVSNPSGWYVNLHSQAHPGGFIRGQLARQ
jgi:hypothetical protein